MASCRLLAALLLTAPLARAAGPLPPPPMPVAEEAAPLPPEEMPRRSYELLVNGGAAALRCDGSAPTTRDQVDPCASVSAAHQVGGALLWRPWGHWALGLAVDRAGFSWGARGLLNEGQGSGRWTAASLLARGYLNTEGRWEPYIGAQSGLGWLTMASEDGAVSIQREGLVMTGQIGVAGWLSSRMRLGVEGEVRWQVTGASELCGGGACLTAPLARLPDRSLGLRMSLTVALGDEL